MTTSRRSLSLACALILTAAPLHAQTARARVVATIDSIAAAALRGGQVAGLAVAVVKGRDTLLSKGYGLADVEDSVPVTPRTVFRIGSVTKQFTSAAVMQLVEQGKIRLDEDISVYLPDAPAHWRGVRVRHLLNHTSGIPSYTDIGPRWARTIRLDLPHDSLLAIVRNDSLMFQPGSHFYYNNTGYYLLGVIIEKVSGERYGDYLAKRFFTPFGLRGSMYCDVRPIIRNRADGYVFQNGALQNADYLSMNQPFAAGSLCSTAGDLIAWTHALNAGRVVTPASYARMTSPEPLSSKRPMTYGYGLGADTMGKHRVIAHGGGINGFVSDLRHYPDDSLTIAVLANTTPAPVNEIGVAIARAVLGVPTPAPQPPPKDVATSAADRAPYVGNYLVTQTDGSRRRVRIYEQGDSLFFQPDGVPQPVRLRWQGGTVFFGPGRVAFDVTAGKATGFVLGGGSRTREGVRIE